MRRFFIWLGALGLLLATVWTIWNYIGTRELEHRIESLRESGLPTTAAELHPPPLAPEDNGAALYRAAFALIESACPDDPSLRFLVSGESKSEQTTDLSRFKRALEVVHEAAAKPGCDFGLRYEDGFSMIVDHPQQMLAVARLVATRARELLQEGRSAEAVEELRILFRVGRALSKEHTLISQVFRFNVAAQGLDILEELMPQLESARQAVEQIDVDDCRGGFGRGIQGEISGVLWLLDQEVEGGDLGGLFGSFLSGKLARPYFKTDLASLLGRLERMALASRQPYPEMLSILAEDDKRFEGEAGLYSRLIVFSVYSSVVNEARLAARAAMSRLAARIYEHRRSTGRFPEKLADLGEAGEIVDPSTGKPFLLAGDGQELRIAGGPEGNLEWRLRPLP